MGLIYLPMSMILIKGQFLENWTQQSGDQDNWKLQVEEYSQKQWLFNLADDPTEQLELSDQYPEKVYELHL